MSEKNIYEEMAILHNYAQLGAAVVLQAVIDYENDLVETYIKKEKIKIYAERLKKETDSHKRQGLISRIANCERWLNKYTKDIHDTIDFFEDKQRFSVFTRLDPDMIRRKTEEKAERIIKTLKEKGKESWKGWQRAYGTTRVIGSSPSQLPTT